MRPNLSDALHASGGAVALRSHPELGDAARVGVARGELARPFPGVVVTTQGLASAAVLMRAAWLWRPGAVFLGTAGAAASWWPELQPTCVDLAPGRTRVPPPPGVRFHPEPPGALVTTSGRALVAVPAATALTAAQLGDAALLFRGMREGVFDAADLRAAAGLARPGDRRLWRDIARAMRQSPWSPAELQLHELLRGAQVRGWRGNHAIVARDGRHLVVDTAFLRSRVAIEVDSWSFHSSREQLESDWARHNELEALGWRVLHVTPRQLNTEPEKFIAQLRTLLTQRELPKCVLW